MPPKSQEVSLHWDTMQDSRKYGTYEDKIHKSKEMERRPTEIKNIKINSASWSSFNVFNIIIVSIIGTILAMRGLNINGIDTMLQNQLEDYRAERRIEFAQNGNMESLLGDGVKQDPAALAAALELVEELANEGEAGLVHMGAISSIVGRPIKILDEEGHTIRYIGDSAKGEPIEVEYHPPSSANPQGHWTLPGGKEPEIVGGNNDCLFDVVTHQIGGDSRCLRAETVSKMITDLPSLASQILDIDHLKASKSTSLLEGGANYGGHDGNDAAHLLDNSQGRPSASSSSRGHPRSHVSDKSKAKAPRNTNSIENYSYGGGTGKTGFLSKADENRAVDEALRSEEGRKAMDRLNEGSTKEEIVVPIRIKSAKWKNGKKIQTFKSKGVKLVLEHHVGQETHKDADVFIRTAYPVRY